ncbi:hypothetical protein Mal15_23560 [Stieleria maiorica]|uniref:Cytochrome c domain-containing protein n=1 Tax=Stieleria maiorica TaxID=2795974 RepID=A0A5B9MFC3_9BACT|nr:PVC-type heme-binding CxxCH protein [Stieleria maiorica]QEF98304.1 hypothetical protein Mal15_23560 [Stieleria maiorica]
MQRFATTFLGLFAVVACLGVTDHATAEANGQTQLFDGKTLDDWQFDGKHWRVEDGSIVGEIPKGQTLRENTWMIWSGGELKDFDLRLQVKLTGAPQANSGIQFRAQATDPRHVSGYQADLDMGATWLGRIYDEHGRALLVERGQRVSIDRQGRRTAKRFSPAGLFAPIFRENDWNDYRIVAIGSRVNVFVNGTLFSELIDDEAGAADLSGKLAFQLHSGPETRVAFRNIVLETLTPDDARLGPTPLTTIADQPRPVESAVGILPRDGDANDLDLGFESGDLNNWTATGDAFNGQPVKEDTIGQRWSGQSSGKHGDYFIGGYEVTRSDAAQGTLTSIWFKASAPFASFLVAGGDTAATRVDILARRAEDDAEQVIATASGDRREQMQRVVIDLRSHQGRSIAIRLVDESSGPWGHLNFDDFRFHPTRPEVAAAESGSPLDNPLLHHLLANPKPTPVAGETLAKMSVPAGFEVDLIAAEPDVHQPMAFTFDARGRLWVVEGHCYPTKRKEGEGLDKVLIFEDADHDGRFEKRKVFVEGLNLVSGLQVGHGGVWIGAAPELLFIPDRDANDIPDGEPQVLLDGFGFGDTHETINSFIWGPDGWLYGNQGVFNQSYVGKPGTDHDRRVHLAAGVWRYHPTRHDFEVFAHGGSNQWGLDFDDHGQLFMTHCRSAYGRGPTTHVIQGGHYWNQINGRHAPFISSGSIAGIAGENYLLASARYGHGEGGAGKRGSRALYGGHSHVGTMIYLGDNWPDQYRNHLFTHNLHGHQMNHQINHRDGSGFNTVHAGYDVLHCADPQYIGVDLQCGPDGTVYISDWYDPRHCHSPHMEQWQRGNGRMYRMRYEGFTPANVNYAQASDVELVQAQLHRNDWHVRAARLVLAERAVWRVIDSDAVEQLRIMATSHPSDARRLRAMWCLHVTGTLDAELASRLLDDASEFVRGWTVQLLAESTNLQGCRDLLLSMIAKETSPLVKLYLTSAAGRMRDETAWRIIETLSGQPENAADRTLSLLIWQSLAQFMGSDLDRADDLVDRTRIPSLGHYIRWYAPQLSDQGRDLMTSRLAETAGEERLMTLRLFADGIRDRRNLNAPAGWASLAADLYRDDATRGPAETLGAAFGDESLYRRMRNQLADEQTSLHDRQHALSILASDSNPENLPAMLSLIDVPQLQLEIIRQLKRYDDPGVAAALIDRLPTLPDTIREAAMETLCSRAASSLLLLDAIKHGRVAKGQLTGFYARQMASLEHEDVSAKLQEQWGTLGQSSAESKAAIDSLVDQYKKAPLWAYHRGNGEATFKKLCATCHVQTEDAQRIGPKLDGTGAKGIEYIVENIIDPNAVIGEDFLARQILTVDGVVITGVVLKETDSALTIRTATATQTVAQDDVEQMIVSKNSFMPEGLLKQLTDRERIELLMYLMSLK